ncbi:MAG: head-tail connector protein [Sphingomonas pseudosanguinis]|uniref:head-tail connector protein n=1 Tax=Sphingomonas pseudosanguinis TaxID=413712 RepID=UPI00391D3F9A
MTEPVSLDALKVQLRLDLSYADEDGYLARLIVAARRAVERAINHTIVAAVPTLPADDLPVVQQAILMLAAYWYDQRDAAAAEPASVMALIRPLRRWG